LANFLRLAMALRDNGYLDAAILHFQTALELDPSMWLARAGEAICYYKVCTKKGYEKAVELDNITADELGKMHPDETKTRATIDESLHRCLQRMANCLEELGREEEALSVYVRAFSFGKRCETCLFALIQLYNKAKRHEDIMKLFKSLNDRIEGLDHTRLTESLLMEGNYRSDDVYFDIIAEAAFKMNDVPFLSEMYQKAIIVARKQHKSVQATHLELSLATIYDRYSHDSERAARIWERIVETYRSTKAETEIADAKSAASSSLACYWLKKAVKSGKESSDAERCGTVLERLAKVKIGSQITINASESTLMLGSWYKLMGRDKEAWDCFQVQVKEGIRMLSDDDPENDSDAYWKLICVLVPARDDKNAIAMLWMYLGAQQGSSDDASGETSSEDSTQIMEGSGNKTKDDEGKTEQSEEVAGGDEDSLMDCDGCLQPIVFDNVAFCRYCFDTAFCADCLSFLKSGELPVNVCSPKHEWLVVEPRSQEARAAMQPGKILMDGEYMSVDEWKKMMAVQWNI
jgi:tetratricopeptide (TPR) repeat protein